MSVAVEQNLKLVHHTEEEQRSPGEFGLHSWHLPELPNEFPAISADATASGVDRTARFAAAPTEDGTLLERKCALISLKEGWIWSETMPKSKGGVVSDSITLCPVDCFGYLLQGCIEFTPGAKYDDSSAQKFVARAGDVVYVPAHHDSKVLEDVMMLKFSTSKKVAAAGMSDVPLSAQTKIVNVSTQPNIFPPISGMTGGSMQTVDCGMGADGIERTASILTMKKGWVWTEKMPKCKGGVVPDEFPLCPRSHFGYIIQGRMRVSMRTALKDASSNEVREFQAGDAYSIPPGHDAETLEDVVTLEVTFSDVPSASVLKPSSTSVSTATATATKTSASTTAAPTHQQRKKASSTQPSYTKAGGTTGLPGLVYFEEEPTILDHISKIHRDSETRTPIIVFESEGDPFPSVVTLAKKFGCSVWSIQMNTGKNEQNAIDYVDVGIKNGDWVYLQSLTAANTDVLRTIGRTLLTLKPEPKQFPRRHLFRLWLAVEEPFDVNDHLNPIFPMVLLKNALLARCIPADAPYLSTTTASARGDGRPQLSPARCSAARTITDEHGDEKVVTTADGTSPARLKTVIRVPAEPHLKDITMHKHLRRCSQGRDSDSESDMEEPEKKVTGLWFHRAVDFYEKDGGTVIARVHEILFEAVENEDVAMIEEISNSGRLNINKIKNPSGMTPLQFAVSRERVQSVKTLLACGADPTIKRESDGSPLLFMCIETAEIVPMLLHHGADMYEKYEGYNLEAHPTTQPHVARLVRELKGHYAAKRVLGQ